MVHARKVFSYLFNFVENPSSINFHLQRLFDIEDRQRMLMGFPLNSTFQKNRKIGN